MGLFQDSNIQQKAQGGLWGTNPPGGASPAGTPPPAGAPSFGSPSPIAGTPSPQILPDQAVPTPPPLTDRAIAHPIDQPISQQLLPNQPSPGQVQSASNPTSTSPIVQALATNPTATAPAAPISMPVPMPTQQTPQTPIGGMPPTGGIQQAGMPPTNNWFGNFGAQATNWAQSPQAMASSLMGNTQL